ncbi:MAG: hypothetical protein GY694_04770 [Gammaproteobacteria bacterium]|nr:hypothetical protein [Gammaproteobacteria bacterium]
MLDASGIIHIKGDRFLVAEDETDILRYFKLDNQKLTFKATKKTLVFGHNESDFESLAFDPTSQHYYCTGSHGEDYSKRLLSFKLKNNTASKIRKIPFNAQQLISKNVDIEALSVVHTQLFMGYRKPSHKKLALAVLFDIKTGSQKVIRFDLAGRTFRDIVRIDDKNYLILGGPQKGKDYDIFPSRIFWWDGNINAPKIKLCRVNLNGFRAEGIAVRKGLNDSLDILIGSDESKKKSAKKFRILLLNAPNIPNLIKGTIKPEKLKVILRV